MHKRVILIVFLLAVGFPAMLNAQQSLLAQDEYADYRQGKALFESGKYAAAQQYFEQTEKQLADAGSDERFTYLVDAAYYRAVCALELYNPDAEHLLEDLVEKYAGSHRDNLAYFQLGRYYQRSKAYHDAIQAFEKVDPGQLAPEDRGIYTFELAYSYFNKKRLEEAKPLFASLRNTEGIYYYPSNYYFGFISLLDEELDAAEESFVRVKASKSYAKVVPYYLCQIRFAREDYDGVITYGTEALELGKIKYEPEINQLIGHAYFRKNEFQAALPYLQYYVNKSRKVQKEDYYQLGVALYKNNEYAAALPNFEKLNFLKDELGQQALYMMADCYLKLDKKEEARTAFREAAKLDFDKEVASQAQFNYAKLSLELGYHQEAITEMTDYLKNYPASPNQTEGEEVLADAFLGTRNYQQALDVLNTFREKSPSIKRAYQQLAYFRAVELYNNRSYSEASTKFQQSQAYPELPQFTAAADFWLGEIAFRQKDYNEAIGRHKTFQANSSPSEKTPGVSKTGSSYTLGYSYFKIADYAGASRYFSEVGKDWSTTSSDKIKARISSDAQLRAADCQFMLKNYDQAAAAYTRVIDRRMGQSDYALFQRGMIYGLKNQPEQKIASMERIPREFPKSRYRDDALYETGNTYLTTGNQTAAVTSFEALVNGEGGPYTSKAMLKLALIYYNLDDNRNAIKYYKQVAESYPGSPEGKEALAGIKDISVETGDASIYTGLGSISASEKDSVTYDAAFTHYKNGDCNSAVSSFSSYLKQFPRGFFRTQAHYFRGDCLYEAKDYRKALPDYEYVLKQPVGRYTSSSLINSARISYFELEDYRKAIKYYGQLYDAAASQEESYEALKGLLRSNYKLKKYDKVDEYALALLSAPEASQDEIIEANYYAGKSAYELERYNTAFTYFEDLAAMTTNEQGVEARFLAAMIEFKQGKLTESKERCLKLVRETPGYEQFTIRSYILIADILTAEEDYIQAKAALNSIIDHYKGEDKSLLKLAKKKLKEVEALERSGSKISGQGNEDDMEMDTLETLPFSEPDQPNE